MDDDDLDLGADDLSGIRDGATISADRDHELDETLLELREALATSLELARMIANMEATLAELKCEPGETSEENLDSAGGIEEKAGEVGAE